MKQARLYPDGWVVLVFWSVLIACLLTYAAMLANLRYYERWPLVGDTISYWIRDIALSQTPVPGQEASGYRAQALQGAKLNYKDPARTAFYALLPPNAPSSLNGHLYFSGLSVFLFLFTMMTALLRRTGSLMYAMGAPFVVLMPHGLFNTMYGLPSKLPDLPASFLFGAALFALFSNRNSRKSELAWLFAAGMLLGFATLARFQLWIYGLFTLGPITFVYGMRRYVTDGRNIRDLFVYPAILIAGLGVIAGYFIVIATPGMLKFYSVAGYALDSSIATAFKTTGVQFLYYLGGSVFLAATLTMAGFISMHPGIWAKANKWDAIAVAWALVAYPVLLFVVMQVGSDVTQAYFIVPGLMLFLLAPFVVGEVSRNNAQFKVFSFCLILILPLAAVEKANEYLNSESFVYPREQDMAVGKFQHDLAELVAANIPAERLSLPTTIDSNFNYYSRFIEPLVQNRYQRNGRSLMVFHIRQSQWKISTTAGFSGEEENDKSLIMAVLAEKIDIFMALTKPKPGMKSSTFVDDYTEHLAEYVNHEMAANPSKWENKGVVTGPYGEVTVYKNLMRKY